MKWLVNEFNQLRESVGKKIDEAVNKWTQEQISAAERITKLEGEIKAMKARMGRKPAE